MGFRNRLILLLVLLCTFSAQMATAQVGREFWFVAPEVSSSHGDKPIGVRITAMDKKVDVTISMPANNSFVPITVTVNPYQQVTVSSDNAAYKDNFNLDNLENRPHNTVLNKGLYVKAEGGDITAYYEAMYPNNPDIFTLKGENALGTEFYVPSQNEFPNRPLTVQGYERVDIVATEDGTTVTISPKAAILDGSGTTPVTVVLNKGQTYGIVANEWKNASFTLGGSYIKSDKKIAVTISDDSLEQFAKSGAYDLVGDQIVPVNIVGKEYVAIKTNTLANSVNKVYVLAIEDNTSVKIGNLPEEWLVKGQIKAVDIADDALYIKGSKKLYVYQVSGLANDDNNGSEFGSALLPAISCTGSKRVHISRVYSDDFWVQIMVQGSNRNKFKMYDSNGTEVTSMSNALNTADWKQVSGTTMYTLAVNMENDPYKIGTGKSYSIENTDGLFHLSVFDKNGGSLSYGYFSSYSSAKIEPPTQMCIGTTVRLESKYPDGTFKWYSNSSLNTVLSTEAFLEVDKSGRYFLVLDDDLGCLAKDSVDVKLTEPVLDLVDTMKVCPQEPVTLTLPSEYTYLWSTGETSNSITVMPVAGKTDTISVTAKDVQGCSKTDDVMVITAKEAKMELTHAGSEVCVGDTIWNRTSMSNYRWTFNGVPVPAYDNKDYIIATASGQYSVSGTSVDGFGCQGSETAQITVNPLPTFTMADISACPKATIIFNGPTNNIQSYLWSQESVATVAGKSYTSPSFSVVEAGTVWLEVTSNKGCKAKASAKPSWYAPKTVQIGYRPNSTTPVTTPDNVNTCPENAVSLTATTGFTSYVWSVNGTVRTDATGAALNNVTVTSGGTTTVLLQATDANNCSVTDAITVTGYASPAIATSKSEYCVGELVSVTPSMVRYEWKLGAVVVSTKSTYIPAQSGTYTVTCWDGNNCSSASASFVVNPLPVAGIAGTTVCAEETFVFTGSSTISGSSYKWGQDGEAIDPSKNYTSAQFSVTEADSVRLVVTTAKGCQAKASAMPSWYPQPSVSISYTVGVDSQTSDEVYICPLSSVVLTGTASGSGAGSYAYNWIVDGASAGSGTSLNVTAPTTNQRTVELHVTDANGCTAADTLTIIAYDNPEDLLATLVPDICLGQELSVESIRNSLVSHRWEYLADGSVNSLYSFTPGKAGIYRLTIWNNDNCTAHKDFKVHDPGLLLAAPGNVLDVCYNQSHTFVIAQAQDGFSYNWSNDILMSNVIATGSTFNATQPGSYWVHSQSSIVNGCEAQAEVNLSWLPSKMLNIDSELKICSNSTIDLVGDADMTNYNWYLNNLLVASGSNTYTVSQAGNYRVEATYTKGGASCPIVQTFDVAMDMALPLLQLDQSLLCAPGVVCLCSGEKVELKANSGFIEYQWYEVIGGAEFILTGKTAPQLEVLNAGTYRLYAKQSDVCSAHGDIVVNVTKVPELKLDVKDISVCKGTEVVINNTATDPRAYKYSWELNNQIVSTGMPYAFFANKTSSFILSASVEENGKTCKSDTTVTVTVPVAPMVSLTDEKKCDTECVLLGDKFDPLSVPGLVSYDWYYNGTLLAKNACVNQSGVYDLLIKVSDKGIECEYNYRFNLEVVASPALSGMTDPNALCEGQSTTLDAGADYFNYKWNYYSDAAGTILGTQSYPNQRTISVKEAGYYKLTAWARSGATTCKSESPILHLVVNPNPKLELSKSGVYLCAGGEMLLEAKNTNAIGQPTEFDWSNNGLFNPTGKYTVSKSGVYAVTAKDNNQCTSKSAITVEDYVVTPISLPSMPIVCQGQTATLPDVKSYNNVDSYQWFYNNVGNASSWLMNTPWTVGIGGTYVVEYRTEDYGCPATASLYFTVNPLPSFGLASPYAPVCDGTEVALVAGGNYHAYQWTDLGSSEIVGYSSTYMADTTGVYQVTAWTPAGCTASADARVTVNLNPTVSLGNNFSVCPGVEFPISVENASGLTNFMWNTGDADNGKPTIMVNKPGVYTVRAQDKITGCYGDGLVTVGEYTPVNFDLPTIAPVCDNTAHTLVSPLSVPAQARGYQWFYGSVGNSNSGVPNNNWTVNAAGNYVLRVEDLNGCIVTKGTSLAMIPAPVVDLGADRQGCYFDTLRITAKNTYVRYEWNNNAADNLYYKVVDPAISYYTLEVEDRNGCVAQGDVNFVANPLPVVNLGDDVTLCGGPLTTLTPQGTFESVVWSTGEASRSIVVDQGEFWARVTDANGCSNTDVVRVNWLPNPQPDLGPDVLVCPVERIQLDAGSGFSTYKWHNGAETQSIYASIVDTVNMVAVADNNGCKGWDTKLVFNNKAPDLQVSPDTIVCANYQVVLDAGITYSSFEWSNGSTEQAISVSQPGLYWVKASDGCVEVRDTVSVGFWETPIVAALDTTIYAQIVVEADLGTKPYKYSLNDGLLQDNNVFKKLQNGRYVVYVEDANQCWAMDTVEINSSLDIDVPNFLTPNGDGKNDTWKIERSDNDGFLNRFPDAEVTIYDRYGKVLAKFKGSDNDGWDGKYLGKPMPSDDYWYVIDLVHVKKMIKGNLTLKR